MNSSVTEIEKILEVSHIPLRGAGFALGQIKESNGYKIRILYFLGVSEPDGSLHLDVGDIFHWEDGEEEMASRVSRGRIIIPKS